MTGPSRTARMLGLLALAGALLPPATAATTGTAARAEGYRPGPPRPCVPAPCRRPPPPPGFGYGPPAIVSGYLPRNHNVPMYNEPPARPPAW